MERCCISLIIIINIIIIILFLLMSKPVIFSHEIALQVVRSLGQAGSALPDREQDAELLRAVIPEVRETRHACGLTWECIDTGRKRKI